MDNTTKRNAADKIRPILAAMERSIDSARRRRLHTDDEHADTTNEQAHQQQDAADREVTANRDDELIAAPAARANGQPDAHDQPTSTNGDPDKPTIGKARLKARPKRPSGFGNTPESPFYGAKAG